MHTIDRNPFKEAADPSLDLSTASLYVSDSRTTLNEIAHCERFGCINETRRSMAVVELAAAERIAALLKERA